jgi:hypothetical protein
VAARPRLNWPRTLADRSKPVHCLGTVLYINAINARVRFVMRPISNSPTYRHEVVYSPRKLYAPAREGIMRCGRASTFFFVGSPAAFRHRARITGEINFGAVPARNA